MTTAKLRFRAEGATSVGQVRTNNEDWYAKGEVRDATYQLWIVADGMGGGVKGEVASRLAVETLAAHMAGGAWVDPVDGLREGFRLANAAVFARGTGGGEATRSVMGTTLVATMVEEATARFWLANCGDSRAYVESDDGLIQISMDHSLVAERVRAGELTPEDARVAQERNIVTRAIGVEREVRVDVAEMGVLAPGERILLCSDGLHGELTDDEIADVLRGATVEGALAELIVKANAAGGRDNVTALLGGYAEAVGLPWDATVVERRVVAQMATADATLPGAPTGALTTEVRTSRWKWPPSRRLVALGLGGLGAVVVGAVLVIGFGGGGAASSGSLTTPTVLATVAATPSVGPSPTVVVASSDSSPTSTTSVTAQYPAGLCRDKAQITDTESTFSDVARGCQTRFGIPVARSADFQLAFCGKLDRCRLVDKGALLQLPDDSFFEPYKK